MSDYTSPYVDIPSYSKGPKSVYSKDNDAIFEVVLNVPQMDDDDEWGRTETISFRQVVDRITTLIQEVEDPNATGTSGLTNQVTALRKVVLLDSNVFSSGVTSGCSLSLGTTSISGTNAVFGGTVSIVGALTVYGITITGAEDFVVAGNTRVASNLTVEGITTTMSLTVTGPLTIVDDTFTNNASLSVAGAIIGESLTTSGALSASTGTFSQIIVNGNSIFCGSVHIQTYGPTYGILVVDKQTTTYDLVVTDVATIAAMDVSGTAALTTLTVSGTSTLTNLTATGTVQFTNVRLLGNLTVDQQVLFTGSYSHVFSGNLRVATDFVVDGSATLPIISGNTSFSGITTFNADMNTQNIVPMTNGIYTLGNSSYAYTALYMKAVGGLTADPRAVYLSYLCGNYYLSALIGTTEVKVQLA